MCVYQRGRAVVDLAGGVADPADGRPYTRQTLQPFMSVSKGIVAIAVSMLADRHTLNLDDPVASYWHPVLPFPPPPAGQSTTLRMDPASLPYRAAFGAVSPPLNDPEIQAAQIPAANGIGSARGLARIFAAVIGEVDGVRLMSRHAMENARQERVRGPDLAAAAMTESALGLGFNLPTQARPLGGPGSFGTVGLGGCRAWALPEAGLAFAYLPTQLLDANPDPRDLALTAATLAAAG